MITHLEHPAHKLLEEYYTAKRAAIQLQLVYNFKQVLSDKTIDISDILRGKIQMLDDFLGMRNMFKKIEEIERTVKMEEENQKGAM